MTEPMTAVSQSPVEKMREQAAKVADAEVAEYDIQLVAGYAERGRYTEHALTIMEGRRSAARNIAALIRALPLPSLTPGEDTTAPAPDLVGLAEELTIELHRHQRDRSKDFSIILTALRARDERSKARIAQLEAELSALRVR